MKKELIYFSMLAIMCAACGQDYSLLLDGSNISDVEIVLSRERIAVGTSVQLFARVTANSQKAYDTKTSYTDSETGEDFPVKWSTSNAGVAKINAEALLIPLNSGFVTLSASVMGKLGTKNIYIEQFTSAQSPAINTLPDENEDETVSQPPRSPDNNDREGDRRINRPPRNRMPREYPEEEEREDGALPCHGHATSVIDFSAGAGAGFGMMRYPQIVLGPPQGRGAVMGSFDVLSLGASGVIILDLYPCLAVDGLGPDIIIFENPFLVGGAPMNPYKELGAVSVSEDGINFVEFECREDSFPYTGCAGWNPVYSNPSNGISPFDIDVSGGDPFDLQDIGMNRARYIRIEDLEGIGGGPSRGFDLDAVSVVNGEIE